MLIFIRLIFVAAIDYENIFTTKISRFTVHVDSGHLQCNVVDDVSTNRCPPVVSEQLP